MMLHTNYKSCKAVKLLRLLALLVFMTGLASMGHASTSYHRLPVRPPLLQAGDKVAIVAPASWLPDAANVIMQATKELEAWGLTVVAGPHLLARQYRFAGTDRQRAADLQWALDDPTIRAVFALRGGYGTTRIVDWLDFTQCLKSPKWVIGCSDITTLLIRLHQLGIVAVHGEMLVHFPLSQYASSIASLKTLLFEGTGQLVTQPSALNRLGAVTAPVVGGNLTLLCNNIGTPSALDTNKKILVIEEVGEKLYALDRAMVQLKRTGMLDNLAGLVVGGIAYKKCYVWNPFGKSAEEIIMGHVAAYDYPVAFHFPVGHEAPNLAFPYGSLGQLCVAKDKVSLVFGQ